MPPAAGEIAADLDRPRRPDADDGPPDVDDRHTARAGAMRATVSPLATLYRVACCGTTVARYRVSCQALYRAFYVLHKTLYRVFVQIDTVQGSAKMLYFIYKNKQG